MERTLHFPAGLLLALVLTLGACAGSGSAESADSLASPADGVGLEEVACVPNCAGRSCGDDGCGGSCGECCEPNCLTPEGGLAQCGDDGCGGSCGECPEDAPFCANGWCVAECAADCSGRNCGDDGCGGSCGTCVMFANSFCNADGLCDCDRACQTSECGPDGCGGSCGTCPCGTVCEQGNCAETADPCAGKECGDDGCGGSCGTCSGSESCTWDGQCVSECLPDCGGKECGEDGCGGSCGTCPGGENCTGNQCVKAGDDPMVGDPCAQNADCAPPASAECITWLPDGYCAIPECQSASDCPAGSKCITLTSDDGDENWCLQGCSGDGDCRPGYSCHPDAGICWYQEGTAESPIGGACASDADCVDGGAICYPETSGGEPNGFVQGYCVIFDCADGECPAGAGCFDVGEESTACLPTCTGDGDCRDGYACDGGVCFPGCGTDADCPSGYDCEASEQFCIDSDVICGAGNPMGWCPEGLFCQDGACGQFNFECTDTSHEPNETKNAATTAAPVSFKEVKESDLQICAGDDDWYKLTVPAGHTGTLGITFYHDVGDLDLCAWRSTGEFLGCRYPIEDYPSTWRTYDWNDEFLSAFAAGSNQTFYFKADGFYGAANDYSLYAWTTPFEDGAVCTDHYSLAECKGCLSNGTCVKDDFSANLIQFPFPDPADPYVGDGYVLEHASGYNWVRRETAMLIRHAIHEVQEQFPGTGPLGLMDMCQIDGITPGFDVGQPRHPETTHDEGGNIDVAYYQTVGDYSQGQVICDPAGTSTDGYYCTSVANHIVDLPRTAYFLAMLAQSDRFRVAGVDQLIAPLLLDALDDLKNGGVISSSLAAKTASQLAYGEGWPFHHHHMHLSLKWWSQRDDRHEPPIQCGFRMPGDGTWQGYLENYGPVVD